MDRSIHTYEYNNQDLFADLPIHAIVTRPRAAELAAGRKKNCSLAAGKFVARRQPIRKKIGLSHHRNSDNPQLFFNI
jgi:hypothetical protein